MITITKNLNETSLQVAVSGRLDTMSAPRLEAELRPSFEGITELIFDFAELEYISSAGLRVLLASQKIMNKQGTMTVKNVSDPVNEVFEITGFADILTIE